MPLIRRSDPTKLTYGEQSGGQLLGEGAGLVRTFSDMRMFCNMVVVSYTWVSICQNGTAKLLLDLYINLSKNMVRNLWQPL